MGIVKEFREFVARGNMVDLAVGIVVGGAFGKTVTSLVNDVVMPPIGKILSNVDFNNLFISLDPQKTAGITSLAKAREAGAAVVAYGSFINTIVDFLIVALCIFLVVKVINRMKRPVDAPPPAETKECPHCLSVIPLKASRCAHCTAVLKE